MNEEKLVELLQETLLNVSLQKINESDIKRLHSERSKQFVELLAEQLRKHYSIDPRILVFSKHYVINRNEFKRNEYQYDILVCKIDTVTSPKQKKQLPYITEAIWLVESEFARDTRESIIDFNKLVIGNSKNKLFIGPLNSVNEAFIESLLPVAKRCNGNVYIALVTHPSFWQSDKISFCLWKLDETWKLIYS